MHAYVHIIRELVGLLNSITPSLSWKVYFLAIRMENVNNNGRMHALKLFRYINGGVIYQSWKKDMR